jgi:multisubunit Na+/H+ antiporter MnhG subunit
MERNIPTLFSSLLLSIAAFIFLLGAIGFELLGANESSQHGTKTVLYRVLYTIKETLEVFGVIFLIWVLLGLLKKKKAEVK